MGDSGVFLEVRGHLSPNSLRNLGDLLRRLLGWLLLIALLTGEPQQWSFEGLRDEVGSDAALDYASCRESFLEVVAGGARLDERFLLRVGLVLGVRGLGLGVRFQDRDVFLALDSE